MQVAPQVAAYTAYRQPLADALLRVKLRHWDSAVRTLAAEASAQLVPMDPGFWAHTAVPELRAAALHSNLEVASFPWHRQYPHERAVGNAPERMYRIVSVCSMLEAVQQLAHSFRGACHGLCVRSAARWGAGSSLQKRHCCWHLTR
jgi:hypothetical protein